MAQKSPPLPPDPGEDGYDYRLDVSIGDKKDDRFWGDELVKPSRKLSFERDIRVQEFEKERSSSEVRRLVRSPSSRTHAAEPTPLQGPDSGGSAPLKSRRSRHRKRRKSRKRHSKGSTTATTGESSTDESPSLVTSLSQYVSGAVAKLLPGESSPPMNERAMDAAAIGEPAAAVQPAHLAVEEPTMLPRRRRSKKRKKRRRSKKRRSSSPRDHSDTSLSDQQTDPAAFWMTPSGEAAAPIVDSSAEMHLPRQETKKCRKRKKHRRSSASSQPEHHALDGQQHDPFSMRKLEQQQRALQAAFDQQGAQQAAYRDMPAEQHDAWGRPSSEATSQSMRENEKMYQMYLRGIGGTAEATNLVKLHEREEAEPTQEMYSQERRKRRQGCHEMEKAYELEQAEQLKKIQQEKEAFKEEERQKRREARERCHEMEKAYELEQAEQLKKIKQEKEAAKEKERQERREARERCHEMEKAYELEQANQLRKLREEKEAAEELQRRREARQRCREMEKAYELEQAMQLRALREQQQRQQYQEEQEAEHERYQRAQDAEKAYEKEQKAQLSRMVQERKMQQDQEERQRYQRALELEKAYEKEQRDTLMAALQGRQLLQGPQVQQYLQEQEQERQRYQRALELEKAYEKEQRDTLKAALQERQQVQGPQLLQYQQEQEQERQRYQRALEMEKAYEKEQRDTLKTALQGRQLLQDPQLQLYQQEPEQERQRYQRALELEKAYEKEQRDALKAALQGRQQVQGPQLQQYLQEQERQRYQRALELEKAFEKEQRDTVEAALEGNQLVEDPQKVQYQQQQTKRQSFQTAQQLEKTYGEEQNAELRKMMDEKEAVQQQLYKREVLAASQRYQKALDLEKALEKERQDALLRMQREKQEQERGRQQYEQEAGHESYRMDQETKEAYGIDQRSRLGNQKVLEKNKYITSSETKHEQQRNALQEASEYQLKGQRLQQYDTARSVHEAKPERERSLEAAALEVAVESAKPDQQRKAERALTLFAPPGFGPVGSHLKIKTRLTIESAPLSAEKSESIERTVILEDYTSGKRGAQLDFDSTAEERSVAQAVGLQRGLTTAPPVVTVLEKGTRGETAVSDVTVVINKAPSYGVAEQVTTVQPNSEVLNLLSTALDLNAANDLFRADSASPHRSVMDTQESDDAPRKTRYEDDVGEDTYSVPPSKYTETPGPETVVEMVQDCFQAMDDVVQRKIYPAPIKYTEPPGAETVAEIVRDCFQVLDEVVKSEAYPAATTMSGASGKSERHEMVGEQGSRKPLRFTSAGSICSGSSEKSRKSMINFGCSETSMTRRGSQTYIGVDPRRLPSFPGLSARVEVAVNRPDVGLNTLNRPDVAGLHSACLMLESMTGLVQDTVDKDFASAKAALLSAGDPLRTTVAAYVMEDDAKKKKKRRKKRKRSKKKRKKKKKKKRSKKKKKRSKKRKKKRSKKKKKKKSKKKKSKRKKSKKKKSKKSKKKKSSSATSSPSASPSSSLEKVGDAKTPSPATSKATTGVTQPTAAVSLSASSRSSKSTQTDDLLRSSRQRIQREAYLPATATRPRRRRRHSSRSASDSSDSSVVSQRYRIVTHVVLGDGSSAARSSGSGSQKVYQLPKPKSRSRSRSRQRIPQQAPPPADTRARTPRRTSSQCSNCGGTITPPMVVQRPIIIEAPNIPSPPSEARLAPRGDDDYERPRRSGSRRRRRRSGSRRSSRSSQRRRSSSSTSSSSSGSRRRSRRRRRRHHRRRRRSYEDRPPRRYYGEDPEIPGRPGRPMYASPPARYYGDPMGPPTMSFMRRRARSFERVPPRFPRYVTGYGPPAMADMPPVPFESSEGIPPVSMMITTNMVTPPPLLPPALPPPAMPSPSAVLSAPMSAPIPPPIPPPIPQRISQPIPPPLPPPILPPVQESMPLMPQSSFTVNPAFGTPQLMAPPEPPLPTKQRSLTVEIQTPPATPPMPTSYTASAPLLTYQNNTFGTNSSSSDSWKLGYTVRRQPRSFSSTITTSSFSGATPQHYGGKPVENPWMAPYNFMRRNFTQGNLVLSVIFTLGIAACVIALIGQYGRYRESRETIEEEEEGTVMHGPWLLNLSGLASTLFSRGYKLCYAPDCKLEADRLAKVLSSGPCDSFYDYACSRHWTAAKHPRADLMTADEVMLRDIENGVWQHMQKAREDKHLASVIWKRCMDNRGIVALGTAPFLQLLNSSRLAGWPFHEAPLGADIWHAAGRLVRLLDLAALLSVHVERSAESTVAVVLGRAALPLHIRDFRDNATLTSFLHKVKRTMNFIAPDENETTTRAVEVLNLCLRLVNLDAVKDGASAFGAKTPFMSFLGAAVGDLVNLTGKDVRAKLESPKYGKELRQLMGTVSPRAALNYLGYYAVDHLWTLSPEGSAETVPSGHRERSCLRMSERAAPSQIAEVGYRIHKNRVNLTQLHRLTNETKRHIVDGVRSLTWMDHAMKVKVIEKVEATRVELLSAPQHSSPSPHGSGVVELYQHAVAERFAAAAKGGAAQQSLFSRRIEERAGVLHVPLMSAAAGSGASPYVALLRSTRLGVQLSKALLRTALAGPSSWTPASRAHYLRVQACFLARFPVLRDPLDGVPVPKPPAVAVDDVLEHAAVSLAHAEFRRAVQQLRRNATDYRLADAQGWSSEQLFFVSYAESACQAYDDEWAFRHFLAHAESPARQRVDVALAHDPAFHRAFHCRRGFAMRPRRSCSFW